MSRTREGVGPAAGEVTGCAVGRMNDDAPPPAASGRPVTSIADLPPPWDTDPLVVADFPRWGSPVIWAGQSAALFAVRTVDGGHALVGVGEPVELAGVLHAAVATGLARPDGIALLDDGPLVSASLSRGAWDLAGKDVHDRLSLPRASHWDWMSTEQPPPVVERESEVVELNLDQAADEVRELHATVIPDSRMTPDVPGSRWFGWRDADGQLQAVAGSRGWDHSVHLGGIATRPGWRRRGLGRAVTAHVTRAGLAATGRVSLGLYADNHVARHTYERLGFRIGQHWESRRPGQA